MFLLQLSYLTQKLNLLNDKKLLTYLTLQVLRYGFAPDFKIILKC